MMHGEFSSSDASALNEANSRFTIYGPGSTTAITLGSTNRVVITALSIVVGSALTVTIYDGADNSPGAGEVILKGAYAANGGEAHTIRHTCQAGTYPKVKTSGSGNVDVIFHGYIE